MFNEAKKMAWDNRPRLFSILPSELLFIRIFAIIQKSFVSMQCMVSFFRVYKDSWYESKYDSTEQVNRPFLIFPHYGEFYPLYKENVDIVFPADVESGRLHVELYRVVEGYEDHQFAGLDFSFERVDGVLTLYAE